ncbi:uncharacterized protein PHALS_15239 [Plasmopara halstedii]|uniref:Uncharacterized protein n=1 Tax=Plasmopara halstedii TaxID=4781 RepID=A0A0P1B6F5_PLAHL|nr:uncharacterized protein PHALS_15239 [Plasmopara halstedii]CEG49812.1 hypothetical protein PHALS_15239 [Plasmopara halstedii]|eukprot:XP_024586181.1 hypothetical protein PHALS_15239 [Plasmopara halstedii]
MMLHLSSKALELVLLQASRARTLDIATITERSPSSLRSPAHIRIAVENVLFAEAGSDQKTRSLIMAV